MKPDFFARAGNQTLIPLRIALVISVFSILVFDVRAQTSCQTSDQSGFTVVSTQTITSTASGVKRLRGVHVRYQRSDCAAKEIKTYFKEDGIPDPPQIQQYLRRNDRSLSVAALRQNPSFVREEEVLGFQTFVLRDYFGNRADEYTETFLAPSLQGIQIKQVVVMKGAVEVIEPVSILLGEPDEKTLMIAPVGQGKELQTVTSTGAPQKIDFTYGVLQGHAFKKVQPPYPAEARAANVAGSVLVQILVSEEGKVIEALPISGHPLLREAALEAVRQWLFKPTEISAMPVKVQDFVTFNFTLQ